MADKIVLKAERYKNYNMDELTLKLSEAASRAEAGTVAGASGALACAMALRLANGLLSGDPENERYKYLVKNIDSLRTYMSVLMDQDIRCRAPMVKAIRENRPVEELDACLHPASEITEEIVGMMNVLLDFLIEMSGKLAFSDISVIQASLESAMAAVRISGAWINYLSDLSTEETFKFVMRREYEITYGEITEKYNKITETVGSYGR